MKKVENYQTTQGLASFVFFFIETSFFHQNILSFPRRFFAYKSQTSPADFFSFSPVFTKHQSLFPSLVFYQLFQTMFLFEEIDFSLDLIESR